MLNDRQEKIALYLMQQKYAKVEQLAQDFKVSIETIRRDLLTMEKEAAIKRIRGGAIYDVLRAKELAYEKRTTQNLTEKREIGKLAAQFINDGDTLVINPGTTMEEFAKCIKDKNNLIVITNSIDIAEILNTGSNQVYMTGGQLQRYERWLAGESCLEYLAKFRVDKAVLSVGGVSSDPGVTEYHVEGTPIIKQMLSIGSIKMILADHSKFSQICLNSICEIDKINHIFTDWNTPVKEITKIQEKGVHIHVAKKPQMIE